MSAFQVVQRVAVITYEDRVVLETDDWLEAEAEVSRRNGHASSITRRREPVEIRGAHPTHDFDSTITGVSRCRNKGCDSYRNGSYGSHAPCGFTFQGSLGLHIEEWEAGQ